ncbi:MAG: polynucleotide kinasephosphatase [Gemmataceae bacterium]|nr:polynucleotide kinasephosphatase [Gemmataceae bacterium]
MTINIPELSLVVVVGPSGSGKSTFCRKHFKPTEVLSSDFFRGMLADDETDQAASADAFEVLHQVAAKRLAAGRLTVIDATNVRPESRKPLLEIARKYHVQPVAVVLDLAADLCHERNQLRPDRTFGPHVTRRHADDLRRSLGRLEDEGFRRVFVLSGVDEIETAAVHRHPLPVNKRHDHGPFDVVGDVHGCLDELVALLTTLGYAVAQGPDADGRPGWQATHPEGRKLVFVGDLNDRGPDTPGVYQLAMEVTARDAGYCVLGNHDDKLLRWLKGGPVKMTHGLQESVTQLEAERPEFRDRVREFIGRLPSHVVLDDGKLVVAHAGLTQDLQGRISGKVRAFALYGETTGESDEWGLPVRLNWAAGYRGWATVVYGHTPALQPEWVNRTICIDTGCVFGGALTALRYPEMELVSVPARKQYAEPKRPLIPAPNPPTPFPGKEGGVTADSALSPSLPFPGEGFLGTAQQRADDLLDLADVSGRRAIETRVAGRVVVHEENAAAALEVMSRFAADPRWLIYLPPTMSPGESSPLPEFLEHPAEAFGYFRQEGVGRVVCEQKHMGSRAVVIVCRTAAAAARRFGVTHGETGIVYTRTGRRFFDDPGTEAAFLEIVRAALTAADGWAKLGTDWVALDGELMPWSAKAQDLLRRQYAAAGSAGRAALAEVGAAFARVEDPSKDLARLHDRFRAKAEAVDRFVAAYRQYCWPVASVADLRFAPFFLLATEGKTYFDKDHGWHMGTLAELAGNSAPGDGSSLLVSTPFRVVDLADPVQVEAATRWWVELTESGGEGMVVKPFDGLVRGRRGGYAQPALKVRGREYLRIIYGPDYLAPEHLSRLKRRGVGAKRGLAMREFALGAEGLDRFARGLPLRAVHECAFAVLALESEPIDPRL